MNVHLLKTLYVLIGPPAVGKSTWIRHYVPTAKVLSRDDVVERIAKANDMTYDDAYVSPDQTLEMGSTVPGMERFGHIVPSILSWREKDFSVPQSIQVRATDELAQAAKAYANGSDDVVIDMTNMNKENRALFMPHFGTDFRKVAVVFNFHSDELLSAIKQRAKQRSEEIARQGGSKTISGEIIDRMVTSYEAPEVSEGFDQIVHHDNSEFLLQLKQNGDLNVQESDSIGVVRIVRNIIRTISGE